MGKRKMREIKGARSRNRKSLLRPNTVAQVYINFSTAIENER